MILFYLFILFYFFLYFFVVDETLKSSEVTTTLREPFLSHFEEGEDNSHS